MSGNPSILAGSNHPNTSYMADQQQSGSQCAVNVKQMENSSSDSLFKLSKNLDAMGRLNRIHHWGNDQYRTYANTTPSVYSHGSQISRTSNLSVISAISISTDFTDLPQSSQQYTLASSASYTENIDPNYYIKVERAVDESIERIRSIRLSERQADETIVHFCEKIYKLSKDHDLSQISREKLQKFIVSILYVIKNGPNIEKVGQALLASIYEFTTNFAMFQILTDIIHDHCEEFVSIFLHKLNFYHYYSNFAIIILHTVLIFISEKKLKLSYNVKLEISKNLIEMLSTFLNGKTDHRLKEKNKHIIIDILRVLMTHEDRLKKYFMECNGMRMLFVFINQEISEQLLFYSLLMVRCLLCNKYIAEICVKYGGLKILTENLSHGSPRVLMECAKCLSAISDVDKLREDAIFTEIDRILQLLGSSESHLVKHLIGFLGNIASSNCSKTANPNKEYLARSGGIESLIRVLYYYSCRAELISHEIIEYSIFALKNLTANFSTPDATRAACKKFVSYKSSLPVLLDHLQWKGSGNLTPGTLTIQFEYKINITMILERILDFDLSSILFERTSSNGLNVLQVLMASAITSYQMSCTSTDEQQQKSVILTNNLLILIKDICKQDYFGVLLNQIAGQPSELYCMLQQSRNSPETIKIVLQIIEIITTNKLVNNILLNDQAFMQEIHSHWNSLDCGGHVERIMSRLNETL